MIENVCDGGAWCPEATWALILWCTALVLVAAAIVAGVLQVRGRRPDERATRAEVLRDAQAALSNLPVVAVLLNEWDRVLVYPPSPDSRFSRERALRVLCDSSDNDLVELRAVAANAINVINRVAEMVDQGLVRPRALCRASPTLHHELLITIALLEPIVWFESLLRGRGRHGYRVLQFGRVLDVLRASSSESQVREAIAVELAGRSLEVYPRVGVARSFIRSIALRFNEPSIDTGTKVEQNRRARVLIRDLKEDGYPVVDLFRARRDAIHW